jgi:hypothetical protein
VVAVDHHPRTLRSAERGQLVDAIEPPPASEQHLADHDEVVLAAARRLEEAIRQGVEGLGRDRLEDEPAVLLPARELPPRAVELGVGRQHPDLRTATRAGGQQPDQEVVGVR